jgi:uncharacterized protein (UPF0335 family)
VSPVASTAGGAIPWVRPKQGSGARRSRLGGRLEINPLLTRIVELRLLIQEARTMSDALSIPGGRICSLVERIEQLEAEIQELNDGKKEVFAEAKGEGFDVKILKEIIKLRKQDQDERDEHETLLDVYMRAMQSEAAEPAAEAA